MYTGSVPNDADRDWRELQTAPIALRERIAISREDLPETTRALAAVEGVTECMIVSTCNRVELVRRLSLLRRI